MKTAILLVMHGVPPSDFPQEDLSEFFGLEGRLRHATNAERRTLEARSCQLDTKMRGWPRTPDNDPFYFASKKLAEALASASGLEVKLAFNEFCGPTMDEAIAEMAGSGTGKIVVATTMMTRGGEHAEAEIREVVERGRERFPGLGIVYAWPYETDEVAGFLAGHIRRFLE